MIGRVARLVARTQLTRGRLIALLGIGALGILFGVGLNASTGFTQYSDTVDMLDAYGIGLAAPVIALVLASAALGDFVDDRTLVYLWLRPVPRWQIAVGAAVASLGVAVPLVVVPMTFAGYLGAGDTTLALGGALACAIATIGYAGVFLALGFKVRRALVWGLAYILIWENFLARSVSFCAKLSVSVYARSLLSHIAETELPKYGAGTATAIIVPIAFAVLAVVMTARWLKTTEVA
ncbi:MAG: type transport system permease protein [Actinomycetota bacterium]